MVCEHYNSKLPICGGVSCDKAYDCKRVSALKEMNSEIPKRPSVRIVFESIILSESDTIDSNEIGRGFN